MLNSTEIQFQICENIRSEEKIYEFFPEKILDIDEFTLSYVNNSILDFKYFNFHKNEINWIGKYECGEGKFSCSPFFLNQKAIIIVLKGQAYWTEFNNPENFIAVKSYTINEIILSSDKMKSYLISYTEISCYGENGLLWISDRLSYDGIKIVSYDNDIMIGNSWDASEGKDVEFSLCLKNGTHTGGAFFG